LHLVASPSSSCLNNRASWHKKLKYESVHRGKIWHVSIRVSLDGFLKSKSSERVVLIELLWITLYFSNLASQIKVNCEFELIPFIWNYQIHSRYFHDYPLSSIQFANHAERRPAIGSISRISLSEGLDGHSTSCAGVISPQADRFKCSGRAMFRPRTFVSRPELHSSGQIGDEGSLFKMHSPGPLVSVDSSARSRLRWSFYKWNRRPTLRLPASGRSLDHAHSQLAVHTLRVAHRRYHARKVQKIGAGINIYFIAVFIARAGRKVFHLSPKAPSLRRGPLIFRK
jgi:hypothetical protein